MTNVQVTIVKSQLQEEFLNSKLNLDFNDAIQQTNKKKQTKNKKKNKKKPQLNLNERRSFLIRPPEPPPQINKGRPLKRSLV